MKRLFYIFLLLVLLPAIAVAVSAFPDAVGFGADVRGAYSGANDPEVCIVNTLTDSTGDPTWDNSTYNFGVYKGALRQCLSLDVEAGETVDGHEISADSGLIIVFEVGGTYDRNGGYINVLYDNISIWGETAPAPGITLRGGILNIQDASDIIIRHLKLRIGESEYSDTPGDCENADSLTITQTVADATARIIVDHNSFSWAPDETVSIYPLTGTISDVTLSNFIISESLETVACHEGLTRGYALLVDNVLNLTIYKGLIAHNQGRNPFLKSQDEVQVWDVVGYNINVDPIKISDGDNRNPDMSLREIFYRKGSESNVSYGDEAIRLRDTLDADGDVYQNNIVCYTGSNDYSAFCSPLTDCRQDDWSGDPSNGSDTVNYGGGSYYVAPTIINVLNGQNSSHADYFLDDIGARPAERDSADDTIDKCVVDSYHSTGRRTDGLYIDSELDANGCGMASAWPTASDSTTHSDMPSSPHADSGNGYTNLEIWIQAKAADVETAAAAASISPLYRHKFYYYR